MSNTKGALLPPFHSWQTNRSLKVKKEKKKRRYLISENYITMLT